MRISTVFFLTLVWLGPLSVAKGQDSSVRDPQHRFEAPVYSWKYLKEENVVMQKHDYSCGPACVATVVRYFWNEPATEEQFLKATFKVLKPEELKERFEKGLTISDLRRAAVAEGYLASIGRIKLSELPKAKVPIIVRIKGSNFEHFVVVKGIVDDRVFLADPIRGNVRMPIDEFVEQWPDRVLLVIAKKGVKNSPTDTPLQDLPDSPVQHEIQAARGVLFRP